MKPVKKEEENKSEKEVLAFTKSKKEDFGDTKSKTKV